MTCGFIDDGYTLDGFVKELPGIYGAVRFKYRPLTVEQRVRLFESWSTLPALDQISRTTSALAKQIVQWDMKDAKGRPIPCNEPRSFRRLSPPLHERLLDIVCGINAPDSDPEPQSATPDGTNYAEKLYDENAVKTGTAAAVPDYLTAIKEYERLEHLQERALETSRKEYEVLRDKSKELHSQVRQGEELVRQAHERVGVEEGRAESSVASFAKLDQKVRDRIVSISEKYKQTGKVSVEEAKYLDRYGIAPDLTNKTLAASVGNKERAALETFGVFKGVNEAKEAEKKASEALTRAKNEEKTITDAMNKLHQKMLGQDDAAFATKQLISLITEQIGKGKVDRSGLAAPSPLRKGSKEAAEPQNELDRAQSEAIGRIKELDDLSQKLWQSLKGAEQNAHQAAMHYRDVINGVVQNDLLPAMTGALRSMAANLNNAHV